MAEIRDDASGPYRQINLNTGIGIAALIPLAVLTVWLVGLRSDVSHHADRLIAQEKAIEALRTQFDAAKFSQGQAAIALEGRLVGIEGMLREVINRLDRDRRP